MNGQGKIPLLNQQRRLLKYETTSGSRGCQNAGIAFLLKGKVELEKLEQALIKLSYLHDAFDLTFIRDDDGEIYMKKLGTDRAVWKYHDYTGGDLELDSRIESASAEAARIVLEPMEIFGGKLFDFHIFLLDDDCLMILLRASHLIVDGPSFTAIYTQLSELYSGIAQKPPMLWRKFVELEQNYCASIEGIRAQTHWKNLTLPSPITRKELAELRFDKIEGAEPMLSGDLIRKTAKRAKTSVFNILLLTYTLALAEIFSHDDFVVDYTLTNRFREDMRCMVGLTTHSLPFVLQNISHLSFLDMVDAVKKKQNEGFQNFVMADNAASNQFCLSYLSETIRMPGWEGVSVERRPFNGNQKYGDLSCTLICSEKKDFIELRLNKDSEIYPQEFDSCLFFRMNKILNRFSDEK